MARKIDRKDLKNPDQFVSFWTRAGHFAKERQRMVLVVGIALVTALVVGWASKAFVSRRDARASAAFARIEQVASAALLPEKGDAPSDGLPHYKTEKERLEAALKETDGFLKDFGGSGLKDEARLLRARFLLASERSSEALTLYQELVGGVDRQLRFLALEGVAYAQEAAGQTDHAIGSFGKLAQDADSAGGFYRDRALYQKARLLQNKGNAGEAEKIFKQILEKTPTTSLREEINDRLAALAKK